MDTRLKSPHDELELKEWVQQLSSLPNHLREALQAWKGAHPAGLSCRELALCLGLSPTTVCKRAAQAEKLLSSFYPELQVADRRAGTRSKHGQQPLLDHGRREKC